MNRTAHPIKRFCHYSLRLLASPFMGAIMETRLAWNRPSTNWRTFIVNDIRRYFAPITGAINGIRSALKWPTGRTKR